MIIDMRGTRYCLKAIRLKKEVSGGNQSCLGHPTGLPSGENLPFEDWKVVTAGQVEEIRERTS